MLISYQWLKQFVDLPDSLTPEELGNTMTLSTVEVEGIHHQAKGFEHMVVGLIKNVKKHENADALKVCEVDAGDRVLQIVCGGSNVREGMKVVLACIGARVQWHGEGELVEIKKTKIRGVKSEGMICGADEIGLEELFPKKDEKEIVDISKLKVSVGTPLAVALGMNDVLIEIDNKSINHRPDLWGHYGMAREVAAKYRKKLAPYTPPVIVHGESYVFDADIEDDAHSMRYMTVAMDDIVIGPSTDDIQRKLRAMGIKPINNIVDITNYVMLEVGHPMHAFDRDKLIFDNSKTIHVRHAREGERISALDNKEYTLESDMIVIADSEQPIAIAGVIGSEHSQITDTTTSIIFESAHFDPISVRRTATRLGIRTESSARFEKSLDPYQAEYALRRAVELVQEMCPNARVVSKVVDVGKSQVFAGPITVPKDFLFKKIGMEILIKECVRILENLGFGVKEKKESLVVDIPTWRGTKDINIPEDIVEEIARIYGYDNITTALPVFPVTPPERHVLRGMERRVRQTLSGSLGFFETLNYSFVSPRTCAMLDLDTSTYLELDNPIAKDRPLLRRTLLPNLMELLEKNSHTKDEIRVYELGKIFIPEEAGPRIAENSDELLPRQDTMLGMMYMCTDDETPFFTVSEALHRVMGACGRRCTLQEASAYAPHIHAGRYATVHSGAERIGDIYELHPQVTKRYGIQARVGYAEISMRALVESMEFEQRYVSTSIYPAVERDIAFVVDRHMTHRHMQQTILSADPLVIHAELFDVYSGKHIPEGKKSMAYRVVYQSDDHTLDSLELEPAHMRVIDAVSNACGAEVRT